MAVVSNVTYYVSVNNPNFNILDSNGNATTSVTTSNVTVPTKLKNNSSTYNDIVYTEYVNGNAINITYNGTTVNGTSQDSNYFQAWNSTYTVGVSLPSDYSSGIKALGTYTGWVDFLTPPVEATLEGNTIFRAISKVDSYTLGTVTYNYSYDYVTVSAGTSTASLLRYLLASDFSTTSTATARMKNTYRYSYINTITANVGYRFKSSSDNSKTWFSSYYNGDTSERRTESFLYSADSNNIFTLDGYTSSVSWYDIRAILNNTVTNQTSWTRITDNYTSTGSTTGAVVDENGNVEYGSISGLGQDVMLSEVGNKYRPAVVTAFSKMIDVSTVDTSWFGTYSTREINYNTSYTANTYIEYNNYGVGGTISSSTYTWKTFTKSEYSESSRTSRVYLYASGLSSSINTIVPVANRVSVNVSDNYCPFMSSVSKSTKSSRAFNSGSVSTSADSELVEVSSEIINRTLTSLYTTLNVGLYVSAYNNYVSKTNTYSTSNSVISTSMSTTFLAVTKTSSCDVESFINPNGYSYYTTFYGELANETFYATSWVNSAVVNSTTSTYKMKLTLYTVAYTNKTFGDIVNSTAIQQVSSYETVYKTTVYNSSSASTYSSSSLRSSFNAPEEFFTTYNLTYRGETQFRTYMGPGITGYDYDEYNFDASVTSIYSYTNYNSPITSSTSSSRLNTIDYGGTTYRLSDLISSKSWINVGNVNFTENYLYDYSVSSMFSFDDTYIKSLSTYTTRLATSYIRALDTRLNYNSYSATKSTSLVGISTGDRFIDRVEISRTYTSSYVVSNTVVYYNGSTLDTISSSTSLYDTTSEQDVSTVSRTFISSTGDLTTYSAVISSDTETVGRGSFVYSSRELVASFSGQQNDTLVFASTFNTYSFYNSLYTTSTFNTVENTLSATTYEDWYNPVSWTETVLSIATSTGSTETVVTNSGIVSVTQSITYTPIYSTVDGVYVTA